MGDFFSKIKDFLLKYETKIVLLVGFCLISAISFEFGTMQGQKWLQKPLVIEKPTDTPKAVESASNDNSAAQVANKKPVSTDKQPVAQNMTGCAFVGSKSSNKFYLPTCSYAKRVKPENLVCFKTADEAIGQGRTESKCGKVTTSQ